MESLNIKTYLVYGIYIIRTNPMILLFIATLGLLNSIGASLPESNSADFTTKITFLRAIFINPVIYGIYYEIVEEKYSSVVKIFTTYVAGYLILLFCMYIPIVSIIATFIPASQVTGNIAILMITILMFSILYLYVIPTYFTTRTIFSSIIKGVQFLATNLFNSAPLIFLTLFVELVLLFSQYKLVLLKEVNLLLFGVLEFSIYMLSSIIDFLIFIILVYIIKNHGLTKKSSP